MKGSRYKNWELVLVVMEADENSAFAVETLKKVCRQDLGGCRFRVVDAATDLEFVEKHGIFAIPTLVREYPLPQKKIVGSLSNPDILLEMLGIKKTPPSSTS